jgi:hypothetical protein
MAAIVGISGRILVTSSSACPGRAIQAQSRSCTPPRGAPRRIDRVILSALVVGLRKVGKTILAGLAKCHDGEPGRPKSLDAAVAAFHPGRSRIAYRVLILDGVVTKPAPVALRRLAGDQARRDIVLLEQAGQTSWLPKCHRSMAKQRLLPTN